MAGLLLAAEVEAGTKVLRNAEKPFTAIIGGAKVSDKILILEKLLDLADNIVLAEEWPILYKAQGGHIGSSLCEDRLDAALQLLEQASAKGVNVYLPEDSILPTGSLQMLPRR